MIVSLLNQTGGVGKTTLAIHIAMALARRGDKVLLLDADPQGSALDWSASRQDAPIISVVGLPKPTIHHELPSLASGFAHVVIDGPPRVYDVARSAIMASDVVLIPVQPSPYDVWAAKEILGLVRDAESFKPNLKYAFAINRKSANTAIGRDVVEALAEYTVPVLKSHVGRRVTFAETAGSGSTVMEMDPESTASHEIVALVNELLEFSV